MMVTIQDTKIKEMVAQAKSINELVMIAEKGGDELRYASFRIRFQARHIANELVRSLEQAATEQHSEGASLCM